MALAHVAVGQPPEGAPLISVATLPTLREIAALCPNHDLALCRTPRRFPELHE